ncbi:FadR/GntR family transcriptional regulator [Streptomyces rimosus]|uniref:FadR/GntR family transcriptional regulator n=1 Tax=Streptomyces rimosus TaxID=1927 RepID=UPI0004C4D821|nr:FadR/GntR family transcriptional regulator [Streptomyces rimosus]
MEVATPVKGTVTQRAIGQIKEMIAAGTLEPGQRLPTERNLAERLGISRSSMREAVRALTVLGVLEARHGSGVYVTQLEVGDLLETFGLVAEVSPRERLVELLEVRRILESAATAQAAARITEDQLAAVAGHLAVMNEATEAEEFIAADMAFHRTIARSAGNKSLAAIIDQLSSPTFRTRVRRGHQDAAALAQAREDHRRIYHALKARDPEAARTAAAAHVRVVEEWLRAQLD